MRMPRGVRGAILELKRGTQEASNCAMRKKIGSATVDVGDREHADSKQRQAMANLAYDVGRHAADFSRALAGTRIERTPHADSAGEEPHDDDQSDERKEREGDRRTTLH
jgi:hypothetical protein